VGGKEGKLKLNALEKKAIWARESVTERRGDPPRGRGGCFYLGGGGKSFRTGGTACDRKGGVVSCGGDVTGEDQEA